MKPEDENLGDFILKTALCFVLFVLALSKMVYWWLAIIIAGYWLFKVIPEHW